MLLDSSSAILLEKSGLLGKLLAVYRVSMCESVYSELTDNPYPSADLFQRFHREKKIVVHQNGEDFSQLIEDMEELSALNRGERETIIQYFLGSGDFILLDDGKGARFCDKYQLPFINALLFPMILNMSNLISDEQRDLEIKKILRVGWYSEKIIKMAENLTKEDLRPFLP